MSHHKWEFMGNLFEALKSLPARPGDVAAYVRQAPAAGELPPPAATWTLLAMYHYRARVRWARSVLAREAGDDPGPAPPHVRVFPDHPGWVCRREERRTEFHHAPTGEAIRFDPAGGGRYLAVGDLVSHANSYADPPPVVARFRSLYPSGAGLVPTLVWLEGTMAVSLPGGESHRGGYAERVFDLTYYRGRRRVVARFLRRWDRPGDRVWLAAGIGDWPAALDESVRLGLADLAGYARPHADECRRGWMKVLRSRLSATGPTAETLLALTDAGAEDVGDILADHLAEVVGGVIDRLLAQSPPNREQALALARRYAPGCLPRIEQADR